MLALGPGTGAASRTLHVIPFYVAKGSAPSQYGDQSFGNYPGARFRIRGFDSGSVGIFVWNTLLSYRQNRGHFTDGGFQAEPS
jgi:hypothetical protein